MSKKIGSQTPTRSKILPFEKSSSDEAIKLYEKSKRKAYEWQKNLLDAVLAVNDDDLWAHMKFGFSIPRQNGKNEVVLMRELYVLFEG